MAAAIFVYHLDAHVGEGRRIGERERRGAPAVRGCRASRSCGRGRRGGALDALIGGAAGSSFSTQNNGGRCETVRSAARRDTKDGAGVGQARPRCAGAGEGAVLDVFLWRLAEGETEGQWAAAGSTQGTSL